MANWKKFKQKYAKFETAAGISWKDSATRVATLLTAIGNDAIDVFNTLTWGEEGDEKKIQKVPLKFEGHCEPKKNVSYETDTNSSQEPKKAAKASTST